MNSSLKKKLCTLSVVCCLAFSPVFADEQYTPDVLEGFVQEYKMKDLSSEYISNVEMLLNKQIDTEKFAVAEKTADYYVDITKKYYGRHDIKTAEAYLKRARLYTNYIMPDKAFNDLKKAQTLIKWNKKTPDFKKNVYYQYAELYSKIGQPYDAIAYMNKNTDESYSSQAELGSKYRRIAELYAQAGDFINAKAAFNKSIDKFNADENANKYELMAAYSELADISSPKDVKKCLEGLMDTANSFPETDLGVRIDAQLKKLQMSPNRTKSQLDELSKLIDRNNNEYQKFSLAWLYINYYYEQNNPKMEKKYKDYVKKFHHEFDWSRIPDNSLILTRKYEDTINANFWNYDEAQKGVDLALNQIDPVKKYVPVMYSKFLMKGAQVNTIKGNYEKAEEYLNEASKIMEKLDKEPKYQTMELYDIYSDLYRAKNDKENAIAYNNKAINKISELKDDKADEIFGKYMKNAGLYLDMGNKTEAAACAEKYINEIKKTYGENNIRTYDAMYNLHHFYRNIDNKKSDELYNNVLKGLDSGKTEGVYPMLFYSVFNAEAHKSVERADFANAAKYAQKSLKYAHDKNQKKDTYDMLSYSYSILGKRTLAQKYLKLKSSIK